MASRYLLVSLLSTVAESISYRTVLYHERRPIVFINASLFCDPESHIPNSNAQRPVAMFSSNVVIIASCASQHETRRTFSPVTSPCGRLFTPIHSQSQSRSAKAPSCSLFCP